MAGKWSGSRIQSSPVSLLALFALPGGVSRQAVLLDTPSPSALSRLVHKGLQQPPLGSESWPALAGRSQSPGVDFLCLLRVGMQSSCLGSDAAKWLPALCWHFRALNPQESI